MNKKERKAISRFKKQIKLCCTPEDFPLARHTKGWGIAFKIIKKVFRVEGRALPIYVVLTHMEAALEKRIEKILIFPD